MSAPAAVAATRPPARPSRAAPVAVGVLALLVVVHLFRKASGVTFYYDEWNFLLDRRPWNAASFLEPHNEHLSAVPAFAYKVIMSTLGIENHDPYLLVVLLLHALCGVLMFLVVRRRLGDWLAVCAAVLVLFMGTAWIDIIWAFQMGFLASIAAGLGIVLALDRDDRRGDVVAAALCVVAFASSSIGLPILGGVIVYLVLRPDRMARIWVWAVPLAIYGIWYLGYGRSAIKRENVTDVPPYAIDMISSGMAGLANQPLEIGRILFGIGAYLLITRTARAGRVPPALLGIVAAGLAFWCLTALARAQLGESTTPRYVYPSGVVLLLIAAQAARGMRPTQVGLLAAGLVTAAAALSGLGRFHDGSVELEKSSTATRAALGAVEAAAPAVAAEFVPQPAHAPQVMAGPYLEAVKAFGESPAMTREELRAAPPQAQAVWEATLHAGLGIALVEEPAEPAGAAPAAEPTRDGTVKVDGPCLTFTPSAPNGRLVFALPANGVRITANGTQPARVALQRFAAEPRPVGNVPPGAARVLRVRRDAAPEPWRTSVAADEPAEVCAL